MMKKRLKSTSGETLTETLVAVVMVSLALIMLPGAVVAAARVNAAAKKQVIFMENRAEAPTGADAGECNITITVDEKPGSVILQNIKVKRFGTEETGLYEVGLE